MHTLALALLSVSMLGLAAWAMWATPAQWP